MPNGLDFDKEPPSDLLHDVIAVGATGGDQTAQLGRAGALSRGGMAPDRFARDKRADRQRDDLPAACFEHLPSTGSSSWLRWRVGKIQNGRLRKERRAGGLAVELSPIFF